jgi:putative ABC transport system permease protein
VRNGAPRCAGIHLDAKAQGREVPPVGHGVGIVGGVLGLILGAAIQYLISIALTDVLSIDFAWHATPAMIGIGLGAR